MDDQAFCKMYDGLGESEMDTVYEVYRPTSFSVMVGGGVDMTNIMAEAAHAGAMVSGDTGMQNLMVGENDFTVTVTAEDEETMMAYMVKVTRAALTDTERLLARYDGDGDGEINDTELGNAIFDNTVNETLSDEDLGRVIFLWAQS